MSSPSWPSHSFAFQPIIDVEERRVHSYEALLRGVGGEPAPHVLARVPREELYDFDACARRGAISLAARLGMTCTLNLNFLPRSLERSPRTVHDAVEAAAREGWTADRLVLEVTESEVIDDLTRFTAAMDEARCLGVRIAIDDFGAGYAGLTLLADFQPDEVKLDMHLVHGIESHGPRQAIVRAVAQACFDLGIDVIAEGVETAEERDWFLAQGVRLFQGFLVARPGFETLPPVHP